ncbi:MAG: RpiB/LacA/LacB family sugar-phosphate isomerase [Candidatus Paceibacterota bacterium]
MKIVFAADHGGFALKEALKASVALLGYEVEDVGAFSLDPDDDYVPFVQAAAKKVAADPKNVRGIIIGGSGQGEAFAANRYKGVRAVVYYGEPSRKQVDAEGNELDLVTSTRNHNDSNILSLGGRFISGEEAQEAVKKWLEAPFSEARRHIRRHKEVDTL